MATYRGRCLRCGLAFNARSSSIGTMRRCQGCGAKFVLKGPSALGLVVVLLIVGGIWLLFGKSKPAPTPPSARDSEPAQVTTPPPRNAFASPGTGTKPPETPRRAASTSLGTSSVGALPVGVMPPTATPPTEAVSGDVVAEELRPNPALTALRSDPTYQALPARAEKAEQLYMRAASDPRATTRERMDAGAEWNKLRAELRSLEREKAPGLHRILSAREIELKLREQPWSGEVRQIPATVVDQGALRHVPYVSYRAGPDSLYEINVYGDPQAPACVEAGAYGRLVSDKEAQENCVRFVRLVMTGYDDASRVSAINPRGAKVLNNGVTFETTPPTAPDSYGGWWVSVYDEALLERSRATPREVANISRPLVPAGMQVVKSAVNSRTGSVAGSSVRPELTAEEWTPDDSRYARRPTVASSGASSEASSGGGTVYVRGYTRKDGTYVRAHTRRR